MSRGWALQELHQVGMSLEEVFIRVVAGEEPQAQAVAAPRRRAGRCGRAGERLMRWLPVFKKEMRLYFGSPVAYVVFTFFLLISGWFFSHDLPVLQRHLDALVHAARHGAEPQHHRAA